MLFMHYFYYLCYMSRKYTKQEFFAYLLNKIDNDLKEKGLSIKSMNSKVYIISRAIYYRIKAISEGDQEKGLNESTLRLLGMELKFDYEHFYTIEKSS